jgi:hypothetical protein
MLNRRRRLSGTSSNQGLGDAASVVYRAKRPQALLQPKRMDAMNVVSSALQSISKAPRLLY